MLQQSLDNADAETRKVNAILYGLHGNNEKSVADQVKEFMIAECFMHTPDPLNASRLGAKIENKKRPIKIKFKYEAEKWEFLKLQKYTHLLHVR